MATTSTQRSPLLFLPDDLQQIITKKLSNHNSAHLGLTCKQLQNVVITQFLSNIQDILRNAAKSTLTDSYISFGHISLNQAGSQPNFFGLKCEKHLNSYKWYKLQTYHLSEVPLPLPERTPGADMTEDKLNQWVLLDDLDGELRNYITDLKGKNLDRVYVDSNIPNYDVEKVKELLAYIKCAESQTAGTHAFNPSSVTYNSKVYKLYGQGQQKYIRVQNKRLYLKSIRRKYRYIR